MKSFQLSTGTKFLLLILSMSTLPISFPILLEVSNMLFISFLLIGGRRWKSGIKFVLTFLCLSVIHHLTQNQSGVPQVFHTWSLLIRRLLILFGAGYYFVMSTNVSSLMAGMEKLRLPKAVIIPLIVMFRYIPVLKEEYGKIRDAMKIRGIEPGLRSFKTPLLSLEYLLVPLLFTTFNIGEELSQAAFSKGVGIAGRKHRIFETHFTAYDAIVFLYLIATVFLLLRPGL